MSSRKLNLSYDDKRKVFLPFIALFVVLILFIVAFITLLFLQNTSLDNQFEAAGNVIRIDSSQSLQQVIQNASDSDAIILKSGSYSVPQNGILIQNKKLRIIGSGAENTVITANGSTSAFIINNANVEISNLKITGTQGPAINVDNNVDGNRTFQDNPLKVRILNTHITNSQDVALQVSGIVEVSESKIDKTKGAIKLVGGAINLNNTVIYDSTDYGVEFNSETQSIESTVVNTIIARSAKEAVLIKSGNIQIKNVTIVDNGDGIVESGQVSSVNIKNTTVQGNIGKGISIKSPRSTVTYSNSFQNKTNYEPQALATGSANNNLSVDSGFIASNQFQLQADSGIRDKGDPAEKDKIDGSRIDIGAFGGDPRLRFANSFPVVNSPREIFIRPGSSLDYTIKATDPDGDNLEYRILNDRYPDWIKLNDNKITGNAPRSQDIVGLLILVTDGRGGNIVHPLTININSGYNPQPQPTTTSAPRPTITNVPTQPTISSTPRPTVTTTPTPQPIPEIKLTVTSPKANTKFDSKNNEIRWEVTSGGDSIEKITVEYSQDGINYTLITTLPADARKYQWDFSKDEKVVDGKYFIKITAFAKAPNSDIKVSAVSEQFELTKQEEKKLKILQVSPAENNTVENRRERIFVEFESSSPVSREDSYIKINDIEFKFTSITQNSAVFDPVSDYAGSTVKVEVKLINRDGDIAQRVWTFNIKVTASPNPTNPDVIRQATIFGIDRNIALVVLGFIIVIIMIIVGYYFVKFIKSIRDQRQGNLENEFNEYDVPAGVMPLQQGYNAPQEMNTANQAISAMIPDNQALYNQYVNPNPYLQQSYTNQPDQTQSDQSQNLQSNYIPTQTNQQSEIPQTFNQNPDLTAQNVSNQLQSNDGYASGGLQTFNVGSVANSNEINSQAIQTYSTDTNTISSNSLQQYQNQPYNNFDNMTSNYSSQQTTDLTTFSNTSGLQQGNSTQDQNNNATQMMNDVSSDNQFIQTSQTDQNQQMSYYHPDADFVDEMKQKYGVPVDTRQIDNIVNSQSATNTTSDIQNSSIQYSNNQYSQYSNNDQTNTGSINDVNSTQAQASSDEEYLRQLKAKYGITDEDIQKYNENKNKSPEQN